MYDQTPYLQVTAQDGDWIQGWREEQTGLHLSQFIETRRHWFTATVPHDTEGNLNVLNLVEGPEEAIVESPCWRVFATYRPLRRIIHRPCGRRALHNSTERAWDDRATVKAFVKGLCSNLPHETQLTPSNQVLKTCAVISLIPRSKIGQLQQVTESY